MKLVGNKDLATKLIEDVAREALRSAYLGEFNMDWNSDGSKKLHDMIDVCASRIAKAVLTGMIDGESDPFIKGQLAVGVAIKVASWFAEEFFRPISATERILAKRIKTFKMEFRMSLLRLNTKWKEAITSS